jgi:hypothetical protein
MIVNKLRIFFDIDYKTGIEYWIPISEIKIKNMFFATPPSYFKYRRKLNNFIKYGELSPIIIDRNFELVDGYISYLIMKRFSVGKVPVYFQ